MQNEDPAKAALSWAKREHQRWLDRPLTQEEAKEFSAIKFELCLDPTKHPRWAKYRTAAVEDVHDFFADKRGQDLFSTLLEAILEENSKLALDILEEAIAVVAKCRIRDRT